MITSVTFRQSLTLYQDGCQLWTDFCKHRATFCTHALALVVLIWKYVVKHKSAKLIMTYAVGKLEAALNISHLINNYQ